MKSWFRILIIGGTISYRALFDWLSPWILVPSLLVTPIAQILLFAYVGRSAGVGSDEFFVVGNAVQYAAIPCLFGMTNTIVAERLQGTLGTIFVSPASRLALIVGRSLPVLVTGFVVAMFGLLAGSAVMGVDVPLDTLGWTAVAVLVASFACTGLGVVNAAIGLRFRDMAVLSNALFGFLLLFSGADIPRDSLSGWMRDIGDWLPLTHSIDAARILVAGGRFADVSHLLATEILFGVGYGAAGALMLRLLEARNRQAGSMELV